MFAQEFLQFSSSRQPDKICLVCNGKGYTYLQIDALANRLANALQHQGVRHGDRVAIFLGNSLEAVISIFASLKAGGAFVAIQGAPKTEKLRAILNHCRASALLIDSHFIRETHLSQLTATVPSLYMIAVSGDLAPLKHGLPRRCLPFASLIEQAPAKPPRSKSKAHDPAFLIYAAESEGSMADHASVDIATSSLIQCCRNVENDIVLNTLPLSSDYGLYQLLATFKCGGTLILDPDLHQPFGILAQIEHEQVTGLPGTPKLLTTLTHLDSSPHNLSSLRYIANTAASLPPSCTRALRTMFPSATLYSMHGIPEISQTPYRSPATRGNKPSFNGIPMPGTEIWLDWLKKAACI